MVPRTQRDHEHVPQPAAPGSHVMHLSLDVRTE